MYNPEPNATRWAWALDLTRARSIRVRPPRWSPLMRPGPDVAVGRVTAKGRGGEPIKSLRPRYHG